MDLFERYAAKPHRLVIGLMSGTSIDGIDAALVEISGAGEQTKVRPLAFDTFPFPPAIRQSVLALFDPKAPAAEICRMNYLLGGLLAWAGRDHWSVRPK